MGTHEPRQVTEKIKPRLEQQLGAIITVSDSLGIYANEKLMPTFDLIIQSVDNG
jgi:hypothetical protein